MDNNKTMQEEVIIEEVSGDLVQLLSTRLLAALADYGGEHALNVYPERMVHAWTLAAKYKDEYIGLVALDRCCGHVYWIAVLPAYQGRGVGSKLLAASCNFLREKGAEIVILAMPYLVSNDYYIGQIHHFYQKNGFSRCFNADKADCKTLVQYWVKIDSPLRQLMEAIEDKSNFGLVWANMQRVADAVVSERDEVLLAIQQQEPVGRIQEELGDLLQVVISMCLYAGFDVEETLALANKKFRKRMYTVKEIVRRRGLQSLQGQPVALGEDIWQEMKRLEASEKGA